MKILLSGLFVGATMAFLQKQLGVSVLNSYAFFMVGVLLCLFHLVTYKENDK